MAKLGGFIKVKVDQDGAIFFRQPTTERWNQHRDKSTEALVNKDYAAEMAEAVAMFDEHFERAEAVVVEIPEGEEALLTKDTLQHVPDRNKYTCFQAGFEQYRQFIAKN